MLGLQDLSAPDESSNLGTLQPSFYGLNKCQWGRPLLVCWFTRQNGSHSLNPSANLESLAVVCASREMTFHCCYRLLFSPLGGEEKKIKPRID